ncbi:MAG: alpha-hydroxy-acid oxidizing protein [Oscillatoria sp. Prado101]|nr:alpha-hydroxy-acid oxidizing protein [Oscillatoria sp. Prado101]
MLQTPQWFQLYAHRNRALTCDLVQRAEAAGYAALCLTVDAPVLGRRERDRRCGVGASAGDGTSRGAIQMDLNWAEISRERKLN